MHNKFTELIVSKFGISLATPEDIMIQQDANEKNEMFFISQGDCVVNIKDRFDKTVTEHKILAPGDYFGEVSMLFNCSRTSTVVSRNYNIMARLGYGAYREIVNEYPAFKKALL